jgi:hypothetical protein
MIIDDKIQFPLEREELVSIMTSAVVGVATLTNGSVTIYNNKITKSSIPITIQRLTAVNPGFLYVTLGNYQMTISSTSSNDGSKVLYVVFPYNQPLG